MESRSHALMAGFFTLALLILATFFAVWLGRDKIQRKAYEIATKTSVAGLNLQAAVRYKGIKVGSVTRIDFDPAVAGQIVLRIEVVTDTPVTPATYATLGYQGLTGIAYVQLDEDASASAAAATTQAQSDGALARIPLRPGLMQNLEQHGLAILTQTEELSRRLNALLAPERQASLAAAIAHVDQAAAAWKSVPARLDPALSRLPELVAQTQDTLDTFRRFSADAGRLSNNMDKLTDRLQAGDGPLARFNLALDRLSDGVLLDTLPRVQALAGEARGSLRALKRTTDNLNERPQSILFGNPPAAPGPGEPGFASTK
ncbi:MAG: MCE family protein [Burkholderiales bacterium]|nr:MCE family protein [Burkholderiales bacterium]